MKIIIDCHSSCNKWCKGPLEDDCLQCPGEMFRNLEQWSCVTYCPSNLHRIIMQHNNAVNKMFRYCRGRNQSLNQILGSSIFIDPTPSKVNIEIGTLDMPYRYLDDPFREIFNNVSVTIKNSTFQLYIKEGTLLNLHANTIPLMVLNSIVHVM